MQEQIFERNKNIRIPIFLFVFLCVFPCKHKSAILEAKIVLNQKVNRTKIDLAKFGIFILIIFLLCEQSYIIDLARDKIQKVLVSYSV